MCSVKSSNRRSKWSLEMHRPKAFETNHVGPPMLSLQTQHLAEAVANRKVNNNQIMEKKAWETAMNPLKQIPMNLLLMYMSGNGISIFPIMMIGMMLLRTVKALLSTNAVFKEFESPALSSTESNGYNRTAIGNLQRLIYLLGNCINIALALYKCQSMGLLPTHSSDWLAFIQPPLQVEFSAGGFPLS